MKKKKQGLRIIRLLNISKETRDDWEKKVKINKQKSVDDFRTTPEQLTPRKSLEQNKNALSGLH
jgi:hypothetical protein